MLVATNSIARNTTDRSTVARILPRRTGSVLLRQQGAFRSQHLTKDDVTRTTARYTTATPKSVHEKAGVIVMVAVILRKAVIIPIIRLIITATVVHTFLQEQSEFDIYFTSFTSLYVASCSMVKEKSYVKNPRKILRRLN
jgi:hypothetical protein